MSLSDLSLELCVQIADNLDPPDKVSFARTCWTAARPSQISLRKHVEITYQSADQMYQLACHVAQLPGFSDGVKTLYIDIAQPHCNISPVPEDDWDQVKKWVRQLFPEVSRAHGSAAAIQEYGIQCRKRWYEASIQSQVVGLLAHIIVRCKNLREADLHVSNLAATPTLAELVHRKLRYDAMLGDATLAKLDKLSMHPLHTDNLVPVIPGLKHLDIHSSGQAPDLLVPSTSEAVFQNLHTFSVSGYHASKPLQALLGPIEVSQLEAVSLKEMYWDLFDYGALTKSLSKHCPKLHTLILDCQYLSEDDNIDAALEANLGQLERVTSARVHLYHVHSTCHDLTLGKLASAVPPNTERLEVSGVTPKNLHSMEKSYKEGSSLDARLPKTLRELRLVFDFDLMPNTPIRPRLRRFKPLLKRLIQKAASQDVRIGVYTRRVGDMNPIDEYYMGYTLQPIRVEEI